jgi:hypothetical protein
MGGRSKRGGGKAAGKNEQHMMELLFTVLAETRKATKEIQTFTSSVNSNLTKLNKNQEKMMKKTQKRVSASAKKMGTDLTQALNAPFVSGKKGVFNKEIDDFTFRARSMRGVTTGLRHEVGKLRNTLLLFAFATHGVVSSFKNWFRAITQAEAALQGLKAVAISTGTSFETMRSISVDLEQRGFLSIGGSAAAFKNLAASNLTLNETVAVLKALTDAAAFNRQGTLSMEEAIVGATQGIKNQNSIMIDNAGITKNVSVMYREFALSVGKTSGSLTEAEKRQAIVNGILQEAAIFSGNAAKSLDTYQGRLAKFQTTVLSIQRDLGNIIADPILNSLDTVATFYDELADAQSKSFLAFTGTVIAGAVQNVLMLIISLEKSVWAVSDALKSVSNIMVEIGKASVKAFDWLPNLIAGVRPLEEFIGMLKGIIGPLTDISKLLTIFAAGKFAQYFAGLSARPFQSALNVNLEKNQENLLRMGIMQDKNLNRALKGNLANLSIVKQEQIIRGSINAILKQGTEQQFLEKTIGKEMNLLLNKKQMTLREELRLEELLLRTRKAGFFIHKTPGRGKAPGRGSVMFKTAQESAVAKTPVLDKEKFGGKQIAFLNAATIKQLPFLEKMRASWVNINAQMKLAVLSVKQIKLTLLEQFPILQKLVTLRKGLFAWISNSVIKLKEYILLSRGQNIYVQGAAMGWAKVSAMISSASVKLGGFIVKLARQSPMMQGLLLGWRKFSTQLGIIGTQMTVFGTKSRAVLSQLGVSAKALGATFATVGRAIKTMGTALLGFAGTLFFWGTTIWFVYDLLKGVFDKGTGQDIERITSRIDTQVTAIQDLSRRWGILGDKMETGRGLFRDLDKMITRSGMRLGDLDKRLKDNITSLIDLGGELNVLRNKIAKGINVDENEKMVERLEIRIDKLKEATNEAGLEMEHTFEKITGAIETSIEMTNRWLSSSNSLFASLTKKLENLQKDLSFIRQSSSVLDDITLSVDTKGLTTIQFLEQEAWKAHYQKVKKIIRSEEKKISDIRIKERKAALKSIRDTQLKEFLTIQENFRSQIEAIQTQIKSLDISKMMLLSDQLRFLVNQDFVNVGLVQTSTGALESLNRVLGELGSTIIDPIPISLTRISDLSSGLSKSARETIASIENTIADFQPLSAKVAEKYSELLYPSEEIIDQMRNRVWFVRIKNIVKNQGKAIYTEVVRATQENIVGAFQLYRMQIHDIFKQITEVFEQIDPQIGITPTQLESVEALLNKITGISTAITKLQKGAAFELLDPEQKKDFGTMTDDLIKIISTLTKLTKDSRISAESLDNLSDRTDRFNELLGQTKNILDLRSQALKSYLDTLETSGERALANFINKLTSLRTFENERQKALFNLNTLQVEQSSTLKSLGIQYDNLTRKLDDQLRHALDIIKVKWPDEYEKMVKHLLPVLEQVNKAQKEYIRGTISIKKQAKLMGEIVSFRQQLQSFKEMNQALGGFAGPDAAQNIKELSIGIQTTAEAFGKFVGPDVLNRFVDMNIAIENVAKTIRQDIPLGMMEARKVINVELRKIVLDFKKATQEIRFDVEKDLYIDFSTLFFGVEGSELFRIQSTFEGITKGAERMAEKLAVALNPLRIEIDSVRNELQGLTKTKLMDLGDITHPNVGQIFGEVPTLGQGLTIDLTKIEEFDGALKALAEVELKTLQLHLKEIGITMEEWRVAEIAKVTANAVMEMVKTISNAAYDLGKTISETNFEIDQIRKDQAQSLEEVNEAYNKGEITQAERLNRASQINKYYADVIDTTWKKVTNSVIQSVIKMTQEIVTQIAAAKAAEAALGASGVLGALGAGLGAAIPFAGIALGLGALAGLFSNVEEPTFPEFTTPENQLTKFGGTIKAEDVVITISPTFIIEGEQVFIGSGSVVEYVEEANELMKDGIQQAIDNKEFSFDNVRAVN